MRLILALIVPALMAGLAFAYAPLSTVAAARRILVAGISANPTMTSVLVLAPEPILEAIGMMAPAGVAGNITAAAANNNEVVSVTAFPPSSSTVVPGGIIVYNINVTNGAAANIPDAFSDSNPKVTINVPEGTRFQGVNVGGANGPTLFNCMAPSFNTPGPASFTCTAPIFFPHGNINITLVVRVDNPYTLGGPVTNSATYQDDDNDGSPNAPKTSGTVIHNIATAAGPPADLQIVKTSNKVSVTAGGGNPAGHITFKIDVSNNGPNSASGVAVFDEVPANTTLVDTPTWSGTTAGNCSFLSGGKFYCSPTTTDATLPGQGSATITYKVAVPASVPEGSLVTNAALVTSISHVGSTFLITTPGVNTSPDPTSTNNYGLTGTRVRAKADLSVEVLNGPDPVCGGGTINYTVTVKNDGPSDARDVVLQELLHPNPNFLFNTFLSVDTSGAPGFSCSTPSVGGTGTVTCSAGTLPAGAAAVFYIKTKVRSDFTGDNASNWGNLIYSRAIVSSSTSDENSSNNEVTPGVAVKDCADVEVVSKVDTPDPVVAGEKLTYDIIVRNNGPTDARGVYLKDVVPAGTSLISATATGLLAAGCDSGVTCAPPDGIFPAGAVSTIRIVVRVNPNGAGPNGTGPINNLAKIFTDTNEQGKTDNNEKAAQTQIIRKTDLTIKKLGPAEVTAGNNYTYTIVVANNGPSDAPAGTVTVSDDLDSRLTHIGNTVSGTVGFNCSSSGTDPVSCTNTSIFPAGGSTTITIAFKVNNNVPPNSIISNTATVSSQNDPNNDNNSSTTSTTGQTSADLELAKTATAGPVIAGAGQITYTINIANNGPSNANGVVVTDNIPANTNLVVGPSWSPAGAGSCSVGPGGTITCSPTNGTMRAGQAAAITYTVSVPANALNGTLVTNQANIASTGSNSTPDPNPANNTQNPTSTLITTRADLKITKSDSPDPVKSGNNITYTINVTTAGPSDAQYVVMSDTVPANTTFVSMTAPVDWTCSTPSFGGTGTVSCSRATLPAGSSTQTFTMIVKVNQEFTGASISNTATVSSTTSEPSPDSNSNTTSTTTAVQAQSAVAVTKQISGLPPGSQPPTVAAGNLVSYTISISNPGPGNAVLTAAGLSDTIPANTTFVSFSGTGILGGSACDFSSNKLTCLPGGNVPAGTTAAANNVTLVLRVNSDAPVGALANSATANVSTSNTGGQTPSSSAIVNVVRSVDLTIKKKAPDFVRAGDTFTYTITVANNGPSAIPASPTGGVAVTDVLPPQVTLLSTGASGAGNFTASGTSTITFNNHAAIQVGGTATLTITVRVNSNVPVNTQITNTTTIAETLAETSDPVTDNNSSTAVSTTTTGADLQLSKTADRNSVESGGGAATGRIKYTVNIANNGPSTANAVQVTDNIPAFTNLIGSVSFTGTSFVPASGPPAPATPAGNCSVDAGGKITCQITSNSGALLIGQSATISYTVEVPPGVPVGTVITNQAAVASVGPDPTADPNTANNNDITSTVVSFGADLSVEKTSLPSHGSSVIAGQFIDYTITIRNDGPSDASNVTLTETLSNDGAPNPASVRSTFVSLDVSGAPGFTCSTPSVGGTGSITCHRTILPPTGVNPPVIRIRALVDPSATTGTVDNRVLVSSSTSDPKQDNNEDLTSHPVNTFSTLALVKSAQPDPVVAGQNLAYTLSVTNNGASDALDVVLTDKIPAYTTLVSFNGTGVFTAAGTCAFNSATGTLQCSPNAGPPFAVPSGNPPGGGTLPKGATGTITLIVKVDPNIPTDTVGPNNFTVRSTTPGAGGTSNGVTVNVVRRGDLEITKKAPSTGIAGDVIDYTLTVRNNGPSGTPSGVVVTDVLPPGATFVSLNQIGAPSFGACTTQAAGSNSTVSCVTGTLLPAGSIETIIIKVRVGSNIADNTNIVNCATVTAPEPPEGDAGPIDPVTGNNRSCAATAVRTSADLGVTKTGATSGVAGTPIIYTINFGNAGPSDAVNVRITDPIPNNTTLQTATPFTVAANDNDPATPPVNIVCGFTAGQVVCAPAGNGPTYADGVLPAGYTGSFQFAVLINPSVTGGTLITNQINITSAPGGTQATTPDPNPGNNTAVVTNTVVVAQSQLSITKSIQSATFAQSPPAPAGSAVPGTQLTYRITVTNNGPSDVSNIRVLDTLPSNVKYLSINQSGGFGTIFTCTPPTGIVDPSGNGGTVQCTAPTMSATAPNNIATIDLTVFIDPSTKVNLVNKVDVNATINNFNQPTSATFTLTTPVGPQSEILATKTHDIEPDTGANKAGRAFTYTITVKNNGPSTAALINIKDILPAGQTLEAAPDASGAPGFSCNPSTPGSGGTINCFAAAMLPNVTAIIRLKVKVDSCQAPGRYFNEVRVSSMSNNHSSQAPIEPLTSPQTGTIFLNARVTDTVDVVARPDLSITKTAPATVVSGTTMTYTIEATNNGPSCANNVAITDQLPAGSVFVSQTTEPAATTVLTPAVNASGTVKATWAGLIKPGARLKLTIILRVCSEVLCDTILTNTASVSYDPRIPSPNPNEALAWDVDPNSQNNSASAETKAQAQSDLSIIKGGPAFAPYSTSVASSIITYTLNFSNAGPSNAAGTTIVDVLPKGFTIEGQPASTVLGTAFTITTANGVTTVTASLGVLGDNDQCTTNRPVAGTITIRARVPIHHPVVTVTNVATISTTNCQPDPKPDDNTSLFNTYIVAPSTDPQSAYPAGKEVSDQQAGSILFFPIYTSDAANNSAQNTRISITNISPTDRACVHLFAVDGSTCAVLDAFVCLSQNQTVSYLASDFDPGNSGYLFAVAVDCETGLPAAFNCLIGDEYVKFSSGHAASLGAEAIQALMPFPAGTNAGATSATLRFDGMSYNRLPRVLAADNIPSVRDGNQTMLILNRIGGDFTISGATIGNINGQLFDDAETGYSFTANLGECQSRQMFSNGFPRTFTPFTSIIPAGRSGWIKFWTVEDRALLGAMINFNPTASSNQNAFNQGHNLHKLTLTDKATIVVPIFLPTCSN
jgi:uncharacterized repeat protein (TIGR01451 family)